MNYLQLCQRVQLLLRASTGALGQTPTSVLSQSGVELEIVTWVNMAYQDIQSEQREWRFRTKRGSLALSSGTRVYTIANTIADFEEMLPSMAQTSQRFITVYKTADGSDYERQLWYVPYEDWHKGVLDFGARPNGAPTRYTIEPDGQLALDPTPDDAYTAVFDYRRSIHALTTDDDVTTGTPIIPERHHMAIVWKALLYYPATRSAAPDVVARWERELSTAMNRLRLDQLPEPLAVC